MTNQYLADPLFQEALPVLLEIEAHGHEAYFVGGSVRDTLLGLPIHDIDIASSARPEEIQCIFRRTIDLAMEHGTIIVLMGDKDYEITTFRTEEGYTDGRRPDKVHFIRDLEEDTLRRDFTINSLAFNRQGKLFDYHHGKEDLDVQLIRAVGEPSDRFGEDSLRMIRAVRFASQLNFDIEADTLKAIQELKANIQQVSIERTREELTKTLVGDYFYEKGDLLVESGLWEYLPELSTKDSSAALKELRENLQWGSATRFTRSESFLWTLMVRALDLKESTAQRQLLRRWKHSNHTLQEVQDYSQLMDLYLEDGLTLWDVYRFEEHLIQNVDCWAHQKELTLTFDYEELSKALPIRDRSELKLDGRKIMELLSMTKGSSLVGEILEKAEYQVVIGELTNSREALDDFVMNYS